MPEAVEGASRTVGRTGVPGSFEGMISNLGSPLEPSAMVL